MPVLLVVLLVELDHPGDLALVEDREHDDALVLAARLLADVLGRETGPPARHLGIGAKLDQASDVLLGERAQDDTIPRNSIAIL